MTEIKQQEKVSIKGEIADYVKQHGATVANEEFDSIVALIEQARISLIGRKDANAAASILNRVVRRATTLHEAVQRVSESLPENEERWRSKVSLLQIPVEGEE